MSQKVVIDDQSTSLATSFALIKTPKKNRKRYSDGIVEVVESKEEAISRADEKKNIHPAIVYGPSPSSECVMVFYLMEWLS